tara:strand:- start:1158 stop:1361 length:204 start_codon:yes stop_codon:yes gene_type:complete
MLDPQNLDGIGISELLRKQPQLIDQVDIDKMDDWEISWLLQEQPQLARYFKYKGIIFFMKWIISIFR